MSDRESGLVSSDDVKSGGRLMRFRDMGSKFWGRGHLGGFSHLQRHLADDFYCIRKRATSLSELCRYLVSVQSYCILNLCKFVNFGPENLETRTAEFSTISLLLTYGS